MEVKPDEKQLSAMRDLHNDFYLIVERHRDFIDVPLFAYMMIKYAADIAFRCAPSDDEAIELIESAVAAAKGKRREEV